VQVGKNGDDDEGKRNRYQGGNAPPTLVAVGLILVDRVVSCLSSHAVDYSRLREASAREFGRSLLEA